MNKCLMGGMVMGLCLITQLALAGLDQITMSATLMFEGQQYDFPHDGYVCLYDDDHQLVPFISINRSGFIKLHTNSGVELVNAIACFPGDHMGKSRGGIRCDGLRTTKVSAGNTLHFPNCGPMRKACPADCKAFIVDDHIEDYLEREHRFY